MKSPTNKDEAASFFLEWLIEDGYSSTLRAWGSLLRDGPIGKPTSTELSLHEWFRALGPKEQSKVLKLVEEVVNLTLFSSLVVFDAALWEGDKRHKLALHLEIQDPEGQSIIDSFRINPEGEDELHDLYNVMMDKLRKNQK